jgi:hypothetical protein
MRAALRLTLVAAAQNVNVASQMASVPDSGFHTVGSGGEAFVAGRANVGNSARGSRAQDD